MRKKILLIAFALLLGFGISASAADIDSGYIFLKNSNGTYLNIEKGLKSTAIEPGWYSAQWTFEKIAGTDRYRIKNRWKGTYLNIEKGLACGPIQPGWHSAQWILEKKAGSRDEYRIKNYWKGTYLMVISNMVAVADKPNYNSFLWKLDKSPKQAPAVSRKPDFFINNKEKAFNYTSSSLVARYTGTAYVAYIDDTRVYVCMTSSGTNPMTGKKETVGSMMRIYYNSKTGEYSDGTNDPEFGLKGKVDANGKALDMSHSQGGIRLELTAKPKSSAIPKTPEFFIKNKNTVFNCVQHTMAGSTRGTAKVKSIKGNKITIQVTMKTGKWDYVLYYLDGHYTNNNPEYIEWGVAGKSSRTLDINGEQSGYTFSVK